MSTLTKPKQGSILWVGGLLTLLFLAGAILADSYWLMAVPPALLIMFFFAVRPYWIFILVVTLLPFSIEVNLAGGLGVDFPSEPVMMLLTGVFLLLLLTQSRNWEIKYFRQGLTYSLIAVIVWTAITMFTSQEILISAKFLAAKIWYVVPFYFLAIVFFHRNLDRVRPLFSIWIIALTLATLYVIVNHSSTGFNFATINKAVGPIFRNHVTYAAQLALSVPLLYYLWNSKQKTGSRLIWILCGMILLFGIYTSYTRAAYGSVAAILGGYFVIRNKLTMLALLLSVLVGCGGLLWLINDNRYLDYAPNYEDTITHYKFDQLIEATYKFEDISTMERFYRWVAGVRMVGDRPLLGFGPGAFYESYMPYTVSSFETYVSDNPEKSGIHNYFLMIAVEQGIPGLLLYLALTFLAFLYAEQAYHQTKDQRLRWLTMTAALSLIAINVMLIINDLIEIDKVGTYFFLNIALIAICYIKGREESPKLKSDTVLKK